jgi:superfamily II DNA or RNA helicase
MNRELFDYQDLALDALRATVGQGVKRAVLQSPTGSGKTVIAAAMAEGAMRKGKRVAFVVNAIGLIDQTVERLYEEGIRDVGVIQANHRLENWSKPVQVCSIATLKTRKQYPRADLVVIDECHNLHEHHKQWLTHPEWQHVPFIGLSATPWTKGLGKYFHTLLIAATTKELIDRGFLSKFKVYAAGKPDLSGVKVVAGDYHSNDLSKTMQASQLTADVIKSWKEIWGKDKTLVFGVDRTHAEIIHERFRAAGIRSAYQDANTCDGDRKDIKREFHSGDLQVVCNIATLTTGIDWDVRCLVLARPTKSEILLTQIVGRALRVAPGKEHAIILDHSNTTEELGFVTDIHHDELDDGRPKRAAGVARKKPLPRPCPACASLQPRLNRTCQDCGYQLPLVCGVVERDGILMEVDLETRTVAKANGRQYTTADKRQFYAELLGAARNRGYKSGWAANQYREKFGMWPRGMDSVDAQDPGYEMIQWIKSRMIAFAKARDKEIRDGSKLSGAGAGRSPTVGVGDLPRGEEHREPGVGPHQQEPPVGA